MTQQTKKCNKRNNLKDPVDRVRGNKEQKQTEVVKSEVKKYSDQQERRSVTGIKKKMIAKRIKRDVERYDSFGKIDLITADRIDKQAEPFLKPLNPVQLSTGNEAIPQQIEDSYIEYIKDTLLENPGQIAVDASLRRMERASDALVLETAIDAAESIQARNSLEKMLAHQMAACHDQAMRLIAKANSIISNTDDIQRLINSSVRLMNTFQQGLQTLQRIRTGGRQVVIVQHVHVTDGGQAVVAGSMKTGGGESSEGGGENVKK